MHNTRLWIIALFLLFSSCTPAIIEEQGPPINTYFCPHDNCTAVFAQVLAHSKQRDCALYEVNQPSVLQQLTTSRLVLDNDNKLAGYAAVYDTNAQYMHNKFCVLDDGVIVGSFNPTKTSDTAYNNLLFIPAPHVRSLYATEFDELYHKTFGGGTATRGSHMIYNGHDLTVAFCPDDDCEHLVTTELEHATHSVHFMTFSFTDTRLSDILIKKHRQGVSVQGIVEGQRRTIDSEQAEHLAQTGIPIAFESTSAIFHHKVFIIDNNTVITGSANPTGAGYHRNDENILIIKDPAVVQAFEHEFTSLNDLMLS
jgi:phosphatidylserine/phosphatidylglycerophosphate/cardiolipin synthase-like enzyme